MNFTLITSNGKVFTFFIKALAEQFQKAYGGKIITDNIFTQKETQNVA